MSARDIIIIGGGPAGMTAAVYARRAGLDTLVMEKEPFPGGQMATTPEIENMPGFIKIDGFSLSGQMAEAAKDLGAEFVNETVTGLSLEPGKLQVRTETEAYSPKAIILAMGARRRKLDIAGEDTFYGRGVSYCAVCDGNFFANKPVAVVGGGNTALEDALHLAALGCEVTLLNRRDEFRGSPSLLDRVRNEPKIQVKTPYKPVTIEGGAAVTGLTAEHISSGEKIYLQVSAVFVCVGTVANTELIKDKLPLAPDGRIDVGEDCETSIAGVYAAGDIRQKPLYQIVTAAADGAVAANRAAAFVLLVK
jgi:thioredoxin reductase (NADPH)